MRYREIKEALNPAHSKPRAEWSYEQKESVRKGIFIDLYTLRVPGAEGILASIAQWKKPKRYIKWSALKEPYETTDGHARSVSEAKRKVAALFPEYHIVDVPVTEALNPDIAKMRSRWAKVESDNGLNAYSLIGNGGMVAFIAAAEDKTGVLFALTPFGGGSAGMAQDDIPKPRIVASFDEAVEGLRALIPMFYVPPLPLNEALKTSLTKNPLPSIGDIISNSEDPKGVHKKVVCAYLNDQVNMGLAPRNLAKAYLSFDGERFYVGKNAYKQGRCDDSVCAQLQRIADDAEGPQTSHSRANVQNEFRRVLDDLDLWDMNGIEDLDEALTESREDHSLEALANARQEYIDNPGTDPDYESIIEYLGIEDDDEDEDMRAKIHAAFFDDTLAHFRKISKTGLVRVYRCISVRDVKRFVSSINKRDLGWSWASDRESASCEYHPEANHDHEITLVADAPMSSIYWNQSMVQHFGHPDEHEICIDGPVHNLKVIYGGQVIHTVATANA